MIRLRLALLAGGIACAAMLLALSPVAYAQSSEGQQFKDWIRKCDEMEGIGTQCFIAHEVVATRDEKPVGAILQVRVGYWGAKKQVGAIFVLPTGFYLPPGLKVSVDGADATAVPVERCGPQSCIATLVLSPEMVGKLKSGSRGVVTFFNRPDAPIDVPFSLSGFTAALASLS